MSVAPVMPVSTLRNSAFSPLITKTPCISSLRAFSAAGSAVRSASPCVRLLVGVFESPFWRTVNAWIGMVTTFLRVAVVILRGAGEAGADLVGRIVEGDDHLEILGFLAGHGALRRSHAGGAEDGRVADLDHVALEGLVRGWRRW